MVSGREVGGVARNNAAHVLVDGSVDPGFDPDANNGVNALVVSGKTVRAGGYFQSMGSAPFSCYVELNR